MTKKTDPLPVKPGSYTHDTLAMMRYRFGPAPWWADEARWYQLDEATRHEKLSNRRMGRAFASLNASMKAVADGSKAIVKSMTAALAAMDRLKTKELNPKPMTVSPAEINAHRPAGSAYTAYRPARDGEADVTTDRKMEAGVGPMLRSSVEPTSCGWCRDGMVGTGAWKGTIWPCPVCHGGATSLPSKVIETVSTEPGPAAWKPEPIPAPRATDPAPKLPCGAPTACGDCADNRTFSVKLENNIITHAECHGCQLNTVNPVRLYADAPDENGYIPLPVPPSHGPAAYSTERRTQVRGQLEGARLQELWARRLLKSDRLKTERVRKYVEGFHSGVLRRLESLKALCPECCGERGHVSVMPRPDGVHRRWVQCFSCTGTGRSPTPGDVTQRPREPAWAPTPCEPCNGTGMVDIPGAAFVKSLCKACHGSGGDTAPPLPASRMVGFAPQGSQLGIPWNDEEFRLRHSVPPMPTTGLTVSSGSSAYTMPEHVLPTRWRPLEAPQDPYPPPSEEFLKEAERWASIIADHTSVSTEPSPKLEDFVVDMKATIDKSRHEAFGRRLGWIREWYEAPCDKCRDGMVGHGTGRGLTLCPWCFGTEKVTRSTKKPESET